MMFPNFFYSEQSTVKHIIGAGLSIDGVENHFTEDRRVSYNSKNPCIPLHKDCVDSPLALVYHISKPTKKF